jgi:hypothetical protein
MKFKAILFILLSIFFVIADCATILLPLEFPEASAEIFFDCNDNKFISKELICDGHEDCLNGADEDYCELE